MVLDKDPISFFSSFLSIICWKDYPPPMILAPLSTIIWPYIAGFIYGLSILFHWSVCPDYCNFVSFEIRKYEYSSFALPQDCLDYLGSTRISYEL